jgi:aconitate hydratase
MPAAEDRRALELDYSDLEPLLVRPDGEVTPLRERFGTRVDAVRVGPEATHADLARFADALRGGKHAAVEVTIGIGSRQVRELAIRSGALARLDEAGVRIESTRDHVRTARSGASLSLAYGEPAATRWGIHRTGLDACAEAARTGTVADPRGLDVPRDFASEDEVWFGQTMLRPAAGLPTREGSNGLAGAGITGPMRGTVLLKLGDLVTVDRILPWGARVRPSRLDVVALAEFAFAGVDEGLPERAASHGGGWIVAGQDFGAGPWREQIGWVIAHLGLRAILARSYAPELRRRLIQHGVLALQFMTLGDYQAIRQGDELEMPDLPDGLEPGKPLMVRNLTTGTPYALRHDLDAEEIEQVRLGGLLAAVAKEGA